METPITKCASQAQESDSEQFAPRYLRRKSFRKQRIHTLSREIVVPAPLDQAFEFFSMAENLERLTPPSLRFEILTPSPIIMEPGTQIEYRLRLFGIPFRWLTEITDWEPNVRFVDLQRKGPYLLWEHVHTFVPTRMGTLIRDDLQYQVPGGPFEPTITRLFVKPQVERIFEYRTKQIATILGSVSPGE